MAKRSTTNDFEAKINEARRLAQDAAKELRARGKSLLRDLDSVNAMYLDLTGAPLPELSALNGAAGSRRGGKARSTAAAGPRKRKGLKGDYTGKTIPEAVLAAVGKSKSGLGPGEIATKIGGNRNSVAVALSLMVKEGQLKRAERGKYIAA